MIVHLRAQEIIDPDTEAHYRVRAIWPRSEQDGRLMTRLHDHDFYELFLVTHGRLMHLINSQQEPLQAGDLVFIRPADQHTYRQIGEEDGGLINLAFPTHTMQALFAYLDDGWQLGHLLNSAQPPVVHLREAEKRVVMARLSELNSIPHTAKRRIRTALRLVLAELLGRYFVTHREGQTAVSPAWLHDLCQQMKDPHHLRGGVAQMRAIVHTSAAHLSRTFRRELGCTPTQYLNRLRLTYAANLLIYSNHSIVDISLEVGLDNLSYFYRIFKHRYGLTPAQFRTQHRGQPIL